MLRLENITKEYEVGEQRIAALRGVSTAFRENEFVAVLGPSGCGKTTLLNIIGGLDQYTEGDLIINGISTKQYRSGDWDTYRNHSVGFVFQSYNLIPHQSVLANVELSLTLSGVSKTERRRRAIAALERVGLGDQLSKKPNQMSGGQMQRVAIARALVNNPDILLADEPTGALDSETSVQIMELLKEISADKLIIMVTHNPELAERYATRTIRLLDGTITDDTNPYLPERAPTAKTHKKERKPSMSFRTALALSLNNLLTKKTRTFMTAFAGSIGIIGIALILSLSTGMRRYIAKVEEDTLSSYPITIQESTVDVTDMVASMMGSATNRGNHEKDKIYSNNVMTDMMESMVGGMNTNDLQAFKTHLENDPAIAELSSAIQYSYATTMNVYKADTENGIYQINPAQVFSTLGLQTEAPMASMGEGNPMMSATSGNVWQELLDNEALLSTQYEVIAGSMPMQANELVLMVDENNEISDYTLYALGLKDSEELTEMLKTSMEGGEMEKQPVSVYEYDDLVGLKFKLLVNTDYYEKSANGWIDRSDDELYIRNKLTNAIELTVVGILRPAENATVTATTGAIAYRSDLMTQLVNAVNDSEIVKVQKANTEVDVFTGLPFVNADKKTYTMAELTAYIATLPATQQQSAGAAIAQMQSQGMNEEQIAATLSQSMMSASKNSSYDGNLALLGASDLNKPSAINIYPKDFEAKESITTLIEQYNTGVTEAEQITYTDYIGLMMSSVTTIINAISVVLIAFVAISLVVSSIMIGIITYISVLERTKEIGILRAMGASKRDISRVFNAETLIIGFVAGALGIGITVLLTLLANAIAAPLTGIAQVATLPIAGAVLLVAISMLLTFIAGLIPSRVAAKKDPVVALRTE